MLFQRKMSHLILFLSRRIPVKVSRKKKIIKKLMLLKKNVTKKRKRLKATFAHKVSSDFFYCQYYLYV